MLKQTSLARRLTCIHSASRAAPLTSLKLPSLRFSTSTNETPQNVSSSSSQDSGGGRSGGGGRFFFKFVGVTLLGIGGTAAVCYLNSDVKEQLEKSVPYFKETEDAVMAAYSSLFEPTKQPEPKSLKPQPVEPVQKSVPKEIKQPPKANVSQVNRKSDPLFPIVTKPGDHKVEQTSTKPKPVAKSTKSDDAAAVERLMKKKAEEEKQTKAAQEKNRERILTDIAVKGIAMEQAVLNAISHQIVLETKLREHTSCLKKAMDDDGSSDKDETTAWASVAAAHEARMKALTKASAALAEAEAEIESLKSTLNEGKDDKSLLDDQIYVDAQKKLIQMKYDLSAARENTQKAEAESTSVEIYKDLIDRGKREFLKEVESVKHLRLHPSKDSKLTEEEWNFLIAHAHRRVEQMQRRLAELELGQKSLIDSAVALQRAKDEAVFERRLISEIERQKQEFDFEKQKMEAKAREAWDIELRETLARQAAAHSDHLVHVLRVQREEQNRRFELETRERLVREREEFRAAILKWINRVKGLEAAVEQRAEVERQGQLSQKLWLACQNFADSVMQGTASEELIPIKDHVAVVFAASGEDPTLAKVLEGVNDVAAERGVFSLEALGRRFRRVKAVCKRTAMLDETDVSLFKLALSWLQSMFIFDRATIYNPEDEVSIEELDTFTILANAEEFVRKGDLEMALKFMSQLKGMPRIIANDWIDECRLTLEVRMVAYTLLAFAGDRSARAILRADA